MFKEEVKEHKNSFFDIGSDSLELLDLSPKSDQSCLVILCQCRTQIPKEAVLDDIVSVFLEVFRYMCLNLSEIVDFCSSNFLLKQMDVFLKFFGVWVFNIVLGIQRLFFNHSNFHRPFLLELFGWMQFINFSLRNQSQYFPHPSFVLLIQRVLIVSQKNGLVLKDFKHPKENGVIGQSHSQRANISSLQKTDKRQFQPTNSDLLTKVRLAFGRLVNDQTQIATLHFFLKDLHIILSIFYIDKLQQFVVLCSILTGIKYSLCWSILLLKAYGQLVEGRVLQIHTYCQWKDRKLLTCIAYLEW